MKVLIVDDEPVARRRMKRLLAGMPDVEIVGEAADGDAAVAGVRRLAPDVVLLDIHMPGTDGLEAARRIGDSAHVVFVTAYEQHAVDAFEAAAVDYLLKPVQPARLERALERVRRATPPRDDGVVDALLRRLARGVETPRVSARSGDTVRVFDAREIGRFHAQDGYAVFRHEGREYVLDDTLATLADRLEPAGFLRVHRGELVNLARVRALRRDGDAPVVELSDGQLAPVSRRHLPELKRRLGIGGG